MVVRQVDEAGESHGKHHEYGRESQGFAHRDHVRRSIHDAEVDGEHHQHEEEEAAPRPDRVVDGTILSGAIGSRRAAPEAAELRASRRQPLAPRDFVQSHGDTMPESDKGLFQHTGFFGQASEPPVVGMHGSMKAKVMKAARLAVHQTRHAEPF
jgi:hypothetical protein